MNLCVAWSDPLTLESGYDANPSPRYRYASYLQTRENRPQIEFTHFKAS